MTRPSALSIPPGHLAPATTLGPCADSPDQGGHDLIDVTTSFLTDLREQLRQTGRVAIRAPRVRNGETWNRGWGRTSICRRLAKGNADRSVLMLSASDELCFRHSLWKAARELDLPEQFLQRGHDVLAGVRWWLQSHTNWLLIVDDVSDMSFVTSLLRGVNGGHAIVVPQAGEESAADPVWSSITIPPLSADQAARLLSLASGRETFDSEAALLTAQLYGNPLALELAGSLLQCGVSPLPPAPEDDGLGPVAQVVRQALEYLRTSSPRAMELLASLVHLSSEPVDGTRLEPFPLPAEVDCWNALRDVGFLRREDTDGRPASLPAAVEDACRRFLDPALLIRGLQLAVEHVPAAPQRTPLVDFALGRHTAHLDDWTCQRARLADHVALSGTWSEADRRLLRDSAGDALVLGALDRSLAQSELLRELARTELKDAGHETTRDLKASSAAAEALEDNAAALIAAQRYLEGRRMLRQAAELGTPSPLRIASILLAITELDLYENRLERAASRLPLAREWCGHLPVADRLDGAARLAFLAAATALGQGRLTDAGVHLSECRRNRESRPLEPDHPEMHRLRMLEARVAFVTNDVSRSEGILREDLRILGESRTASESQRIVPLSRLADLLYLTERSDEALVVHEKLVAARRRLCEVGHRLVAEAENRLAVLLGRRGRAGEAGPLFAKSLAATTESLGAGHPEVARILNDYAEFLHSRGRYAEAESLLRQALGIQESCLRGTDPRIARTRNNLAAVHVGRLQFSAAERLYRDDVFAKRQSKGSRSPLATALNNLGETLRRQGKWGEAEASLQEALDIRTQELGETHPHVAQSRSNLANLHLASGNLLKARLEAERALSLRRTMFEASHPSIGISLNLLADVAVREGRFRDAHAPLLEACDIFAATPDSPHLGIVLLAAGQNALRLRKRGRGELLLRRAIDVLARTHGQKNPVHARALVALAELLIADRDGESARTLLESAMPALQGAAAPAEFRRELGEALLRLGTILSPDQACRMISVALPYLSDSPKDDQSAAATEASLETSSIRRVGTIPTECEPVGLLEAAAMEPAVAESRVTDLEQELCGSVFDDL